MGRICLYFGLALNGSIHFDSEKNNYYAQYEYKSNITQLLISMDQYT